VQTEAPLAARDRLALLDKAEEPVFIITDLTELEKIDSMTALMTGAAAVAHGEPVFEYYEEA